MEIYSHDLIKLYTNNNTKIYDLLNKIDQNKNIYNQVVILTDAKLKLKK